MKKSILFSIMLLILPFAVVAQSASDVVIPRPNSVTLTQGKDVHVLHKSFRIKSKSASELVGYTEKELQKEFGDILGKRKATPINIIVQNGGNPKSEAYQLLVDLKEITITAESQAGAFYGVQTLIQLLRAGKINDGFILSCQDIKDEPRFQWRSYMLDESRYFLGEPEIYNIIDAMAEIKLNTLHWHLTDDAGWRIEIKQYPKLTEIGSKRVDTEIETWGSGKTSGEPHEGYYTQEQIKKIVAYAKERHIKIIPEIEMPGHASAAIAAYPWLGTKNMKIDVPVKFGKHYHIFDVIDPKVEEFLQNVVSEVIDLFETDIIHIGGDEVRFNHWEEDPDMVAYKEKKGFTSFMDIQIEFTNKMSHFIENKGCSMMGWNEILGTNLHADDNISFSETSTDVAKNVIVQFWKGDINELVKAAKGGYKLVNSYHIYTYLDYSHGSIPLKKAYEFDPIPNNLPKEYEKNIVGFGTQMWREWAPSKERLHTQTFPRIAAYSEVGWTNLSNKDYTNFVNRVKKLAKHWENHRNIKGYVYDELK